MKEQNIKFIKKYIGDTDSENKLFDVYQIILNEIKNSYPEDISDPIKEVNKRDKQ